MPAIESGVVLLASLSVVAPLTTPKAPLPVPPGATRAGHALSPPLPARFTPEPFLASTEDLLCVGAHFVDSRSLHSSQRRRDHRLARAALSNLLPNIPSTRQPPQLPPVVPIAATAAAPLQTVAGNAARPADLASLTPANFLASAEDLLCVLVHMAGCGNPHSPRYRRDHRLAQAAVSSLLPNIPAIRQAPLPSPVVPVAAPPSAPQPAVSSNAARTFGRRIPGGAEDGVSRVPRRQFCKCGACKWCLDNARWDRIFNEKFDDPAYYGLVVSHHSTLAKAR